MQNQVKSSVTAGVLGVFLGSFGAHDWYLGNTKKGITHVCLCVGGLLLLMIGLILTNLTDSIPAVSILFKALIIASYVILIGNFIWGLIEGVMILMQGDAGLAAKGYTVAEAHPPVAAAPMMMPKPEVAAEDATVNSVNPVAAGAVASADNAAAASNAANPTVVAANSVADVAEKNVDVAGSVTANPTMPVENVAGEQAGAVSESSKVEVSASQPTAVANVADSATMPTAGDSNGGVVQNAKPAENVIVDKPVETVVNPTSEVVSPEVAKPVETVAGIETKAAEPGKLIIDPATEPLVSTTVADPVKEEEKMQASAPKTDEEKLAEAADAVKAEVATQEAGSEEKVEISKPSVNAITGEPMENPVSRETVASENQPVVAPELKDEGVNQTL